MKIAVVVYGRVCCEVQHHSVQCETRVRHLLFDVSPLAEYSVIDNSEILVPQSVIIKLLQIKRERKRYSLSRLHFG
jgi:hypothetical protein